MIKAALLKSMFLTFAVSAVLGKNPNERGKVRSASAHDAFERYLELHGDIADDGTADEYGSSISFSADGKTVAMGTWWDRDDDQCSGQVRVYKDNGNSKWGLVHEHIDFEDTEYGGDKSGHLVSLSDDGNILVIGNSASSEQNVSSRYLQVYENDGRAWEQVHNGSLIGRTELNLFHRALSGVCNTRAPTASPGSKTYTVTAGFQGTCEASEEVEEEVVEGAVLDTGLTSTAAGMVASCARRAASSTSNIVVDQLFVDITIFQAYDPCSPFLTEDEVLALVEGNKATILDNVRALPGYEKVDFTFYIQQAPSTVPSLSPAPTKAPTLSPTATPTKLEERTFYIATFYPNSVGAGEEEGDIFVWCLQAINKRAGAKFNVRQCRNRTKQRFFMDEHNQLRLRSHPSLCMRSDSSSKELRLGICFDDGSTKEGAQFVYDIETNSFKTSKTLFNYVIGVPSDNALDKVRLFVEGGENVNDSANSWNLLLVRDAL